LFTSFSAEAKQSTPSAAARIVETLYRKATYDDAREPSGRAKASFFLPHAEPFVVPKPPHLAQLLPH